MKPSMLPKLGRRKERLETTLTSQQLLQHVSEFLDGRKAIDPVTIDLKGKTPIADYLIIASGSSQRHISSMAEDLAHFLKVEHSLVVGIEGLAQSDWVLLDAGDVIVHLFRPEVRTFYNLEKMWQQELDDSREADETL